MAGRFSIDGYKKTLLDTLVRKMERATVGTFQPLLDEFVALTGDSDPKAFERYVEREKRKKD
jgi:hypothetical protein